MTGYIIARIKVTDMEQYKKYTKESPAIIEQNGGKFIVRGGEPTTLEGPEETHRIVVVEFPSKAQAEKFYNSTEYQAIIPLRENAATGSFIAVEGV